MFKYLNLFEISFQALGFPMPTFAHVSLILAPDKSKLSKRHGATSVGQVPGHFKKFHMILQVPLNSLPDSY